MTQFSVAELFGMTIRESANDGSDFTNPAADYRRLFLGEDGSLYTKDSAGTVAAIGGSGSGVATDPIWDAAGDLAVGTGANTAARVAIGATNGMSVQRVSGAVAWALPPGYEFDYVEATSTVTPSATVEASANTVISSNAVAYDGSTVVIIEFYSPAVRAANDAAARTLTLTLWDGSTDLGRIGIYTTPAAQTDSKGLTIRRRLTPSAATHTWHIKGFVSGGTASVGAGAGGTGVAFPMYIRVTKA